VSSMTAQRMPVLCMAWRRLSSVSWWYSWVPWEKLKRATFMPARSSFSSMGTVREAGPSVHTSLVLGTRASPPLAPRSRSARIFAMSMLAIARRSGSLLRGPGRGVGTGEGAAVASASASGSVEKQRDGDSRFGGGVDFIEKDDGRRGELDGFRGRGRRRRCNARRSAAAQASGLDGVAGHVVPPAYTHAESKAGPPVSGSQGCCSGQWDSPPSWRCDAMRAASADDSWAKPSICRGGCRHSTAPHWTAAPNGRQNRRRQKPGSDLALCFEYSFAFAVSSRPSFSSIRFHFSVITVVFSLYVRLVWFNPCQPLIVSRIFLSLFSLVRGERIQISHSQSSIPQKKAPSRRTFYFLSVFATPTIFKTPWSW
jgi:hypothetical protein